MANTLSFKKDNFVQKFLQPISKLADSVSIIPNGDELYAVCSSQDGSIVLLATLKTGAEVKGILKINLPDIKKFVRLVDCIEEDIITLDIVDNHIVYDTMSFRFKYFLLEDSYMQRCPVNPDKVRNLEYDSHFVITNSKFNEILKGSSIATDTDKLYFYTKDNNVYAELNDFERQNVNNITYLVATEYTGTPIKNALPLNLENVRMLAGLRAEHINISVNNTLKVTLFEVNDSTVSTKFIISALVK